MSLKQFGGVFGRNPTFNDVTVEGDLILNGNTFTGLDYQGTWDASTNTPTLVSSTGTSGEFYIVSVAGATDLNGITNWGVGDWVMFNGSTWQRVEGGAEGNFTNLNVSGNVTLGDASTDTVTIAGPLTTTAGNVVLNESGGDFDFRVESDTNTHALFVQGSDGYVGIGTSSPTLKLDVNGSAKFAGSYVSFNDNGYIRTDAANILRFQPGSGGYQFRNAGNNDNLAVLDSSGNLGLGVTPSAWSGIGKTLQINTGGAISADTANTYFSSNSYYNGSNWIYQTTNNATRYTMATNFHAWYTAPSGTAGNTIPFTQDMTLDSIGRLLVGITSAAAQTPSGSIQYPAGAHLVSGGFGRLWVPGQQIGSATFAGLYGLATTYNAYYSGGWKSLGGGTAGAITIDEGIFAFSNTNSVGAADQPLTWTNRLVVDNSGALIAKPAAGTGAVFNEDGVDADFRVESDTNTHALFVDGGNSRVGINNSAPTALLDIATSTGAHNGVNVRFNTANFPIGFGVANANGFPYLGVNTNQVSGTDGQTYDINGNASRLDANGGGFNFSVTSSGTAGGAITWSNAFKVGTTEVVVNEDSANRDFRVESDTSTHALFVKGSDGNVGIGASSPSEKLEVSGNIKTSAPTGGTAAAWKLGTVASVSPTSPDRTIEVEINGTTYYLHAKTTND